MSKGTGESLEIASSEKSNDDGNELKLKAAFVQVRKQSFYDPYRMIS